MKTYVGHPVGNGYDNAGDVIVVEDAGDGRARKLPLRLDLRNHSPTGFAWRYCGSGPAQLALAMLCDVVGDDEALRHYQAFKFAKISRLEGSFELTEDEIRAWLESEKKRQAEKRKARAHD